MTILFLFVTKHSSFCEFGVDGHYLAFHEPHVTPDIYSLGSNG
jgi:hypothetical protein